MAALTKDRNTPRADGAIESHPMKGGVTIFAGALVCLDAAGFAIPGASAGTLIAVGRAEQRVTNAGGDGAATILTRRGAFRFENSAGADEITRAHIGDPAFVVDDQTVARSDGGATRSRAGIIRNVDAQGVWVEI